MPKLKLKDSIKGLFEGSMNNGALRVTKPDYFYNQEPIKEENTQEELLKHHLDDIKSSLGKAYKSLKLKDMAELVDSAVLMQNGASDVEELITKQEPTDGPMKETFALPPPKSGFKHGDSVREVVETFLTNLEMLEILVQQGRIDPSEAFQRTLKLTEVLAELRNMDD